MVTQHVKCAACAEIAPASRSAHPSQKPVAPSPDVIRLPGDSVAAGAAVQCRICRLGPIYIDVGCLTSVALSVLERAAGVAGAERRQMTALAGAPAAAAHRPHQVKDRGQPSPDSFYSNYFRSGEPDLHQGLRGRVSVFPEGDFGI
jgi:hypothetical protein